MKEEEKYFAAYLTIQTGQVTDDQLEFVKLLTKWCWDHEGILYTSIQSGVPPVCIPTPGHPCPKK